MRFGLFLIFCLLIGCASAPPEEVTAKIKLLDNGATLFFQGNTSNINVNTAIQLAEQSPVKISKLVITSQGGDVHGGMLFGDWVYEQKLDVTVRKLCFSSCANYIFTAANSVIVESNSIVGWHGGALQDNWILPWYMQFNPWWMASYNEDLTQWREKESELFVKFGVKQEITVLGHNKLFTNRVKEVGWTYSVDNLASLGVDNIIFDDGQPSLNNKYISVSLLDIREDVLKSLLRTSNTDNGT